MKPRSAILAVLFAMLPLPAAAQAAEALFDDGVLHEVRLWVHPDDLHRLRESFHENTFYPADLEWRGAQVRNVGIRSRGRNSRNPRKPGLTVVFDRYTEGQRFLGLRTLVLDNLLQDPAMLRQGLAFAMFTRMGLPAPRQSFTRLYINGRYAGLYGIVESVDEAFMARAFGDGSGYLFEFRHDETRYFYGSFPGEDLAFYRSTFEPRARADEPDEVLFGPIRELWREVNEGPVDAAWRARVGARIDLDQLVRTVAVDACIAETDGFLGITGINNFYLHRDAGTGQHRVIVWDKDLSFLSIEAPILLRVDENVLLRRALAFEDLYALYLETAEHCAQAAREGGWLAGEIARTVALTRDAAFEDDVKPFPNERLEAAIAFLLAFGVERPLEVLRQVAAARRGPPPYGGEPPAVEPAPPAIGDIFRKDVERHHPRRP